MHSGPFVWLTKLGAKRVELVQKFVPGSRVGIFRNERTRSTPLVPKLMFWCISYYLDSGPFGCLPTLGAKRPNKCKSSCHEVASGVFAANAPYPPHWTQNSRFSAFCTICVHSGPFGCLTKHGAKRAELVQKFVPRSRVGFFRNERTRSTPLDPKLTFWCVLYYLGAFVIWLPYETRCKMARTSAKVRATKSRRIFSQRSLPIQPM